MCAISTSTAHAKAMPMPVAKVVLDDATRRKLYDHPIFGPTWKSTLPDFDQRMCPVIAESPFVFACGRRPVFCPPPCKSMACLTPLPPNIPEQATPSTDHSGVPLDVLSCSHRCRLMRDCL